jgi:integrase
VGQDVPPVEVTAFDVQSYRDHLIDQGRKPATVNRRLAGLRAFFDWAVEAGEAASNPAADVNGVEQSRQVPKSLNAQDVYRLQHEAAAQRQLAEAKAGEGHVTPTVVYDRRRDNLAEQILDVKGFSQLFVISHDDTFEQDTDHVVRVVKGDGSSRVVGA